MGIYLDRIKNLTIEPINITPNFDENVFAQLTEEANTQTNGYLGLSLLITFWIVLYTYLVMHLDLFKITKLQAFISVSSVVYTMAIYFVWTSIVTSSQTFIWFSMIYFFAILWGIIRY